MKAYLMSFVLIVSFFTSATTTTRRILHQPLFPETSTPPPGSEPPPSQPPPTASEHPFFHENPNGKTESPPPPPAAQGVATNSTATHPIAPQPANKPIKKIAVAISVGLVTLGMLSALAFFIYKHKSKQQSESRKLVRGNSFQGNNEEMSINLPPSSFLYIGTVEPSITTTESTNGTRNGSPYNKLNSIKRSDRYRPSPELQPLPPLTKPQPPPPPAASSSDDEEEENQDFYTPNGSTASTDDGHSVRSFKHNHRRNPSPMPLSKRTSPKSRLSISSSPDTISDRFHPGDSPSAQPLAITNAPRRAKFAAPPPGPDMTRLHSNQPHHKPKIPVPPHPPPPPFTPPGKPIKTISTATSLPKPKKTESMSPSARVIPKIVKTKSFPEVNNDDEAETQTAEGSKPKLKPLHWDKVRATSDRATVWDQLKSSSFQ